MRSGKVKWYNMVKGYGFIIPDDGGKDVIIHGKNLRDSEKRRLIQDLNVRFVAEDTRVVKLEIREDFVTIELPAHCSHRFVVRCELTNETEVFKTKNEMDSWVKERALVLTQPPK